MTDNVQLWLFGILGAGLVACFGLWWAHVQKCNIRERNEGKLEEKVSKIETEIGTHETGIIGQLHRYSKAITRIFTKLGMGE